MDRIDALIISCLLLVVALVVCANRSGAMGGGGCASGPSTRSTVPDDSESFAGYVLRPIRGTAL